MRWKLNDVMVVLDLVQPCDSNQLRDAQHRGKNRGPDSLTQFPHRAAGEEATPHFVSQPTVISVIITTRRAGYRTKGRRRFHTYHKAWTERTTFDWLSTNTYYDDQRRI